MYNLKFQGNQQSRSCKLMAHKYVPQSTTYGDLRPYGSNSATDQFGGHEIKYLSRLKNTGRKSALSWKEEFLFSN